MMMMMRCCCWHYFALFTTLLLLGTTTTSRADEAAPKVTRVEFEVNLAPGKEDTFVVEVHPEWAPLGAARFLELVDEGDKFWKGIRFFRVIEGFMAQFGIPGKPAVADHWRDKTIKDDEVIQSNKRGYMSFATSGQDSRTTQMFINLVDNTNLDDMGFSPFAIVVGDDMSIVDQIYSGYGEGAPGGDGPAQGRVQADGNKYLKKEFPNLSYVKSVRRVEDITSEGEL
ncbi:PPIases accelerate the folding of proteins. It catalyzes the cis-trans isomerization of proline imidic peptide bonds in oligopeptides (By similarity) [Seminavis robusta]|uniref:peptidylprolyl isomerase n=1 Tax=Seminavis robusta TaxID=568900 RepID=A0A9N8E8W7_9STRA|nr:PPIases accelerate the folding of proteins. It catalyzes the cis-trans isomerization of proline imidic peptide bonds in oligopeptides (By similarity) [Seminavis robusta]|eukprot:Sro801_g204500.1 PPIases accelerate the folding of proteins. It catalyzes the cis-trans isomerization of proline imidic peptide bonds in oligopeptides (By similarity) (227) ;mRNA; r:29241-30273